MAYRNPDPFQARSQRINIWPPSPGVMAYLERKIRADSDWLAFYQYFGWNYLKGPNPDKVHFRDSRITIEDVPSLGRDGGPEHTSITFDLQTGATVLPAISDKNYDYLVPGKYWVYLPSALAIAIKLFQEERAKILASNLWLADKYYVRFGFWPTNERSEGRIHYGTGGFSQPFIEKGVSVYEAHWDYKVGRWNLEIPFDDSGWGTLDMLLASNREILLVQGDELSDPGADGEPLLRNLKLIKKLGPCDIQIPGTYDPVHDGGFDCLKSNLDNQKFTYLGQCDRLRRTSQGETYWHRMMDQKQAISLEEFEALCITDKLLDDGESVADFIADDPSGGVYRSNWGDQECLFIQTAGFEFIFRKPN